MIVYKKQRRQNNKFDEKSEFEQKIIDISRVTRVVAGGRRFRFRVALVIGDLKGRVGFGIGKGNDTALAIEKAFRKAKKNIIKINLDKNSSISFPIEVKQGSASLIMKPASLGHGLVAGGAVRSVLSLAGIKNVTAKVISRSKNKLNQAEAAIKALKKLNSYHGSTTHDKTKEKK